MGKAGRPQGALKGATDEANALARFLRTMTDSLTVRELAERYGGGKTLWGEYRCGARIIPLGRLNTVLRDRVRDPRGRLAMLEQARRLHDAALTAEVELGPAPALDEALRRAEQDLAGSGELVNRLLAIITMLLRVPAAPAAAAAQDPGRVRGHLDEALDQLDTARTVQSAAEGACADARAESAADTGPAATAGPRLSLALALVGSALDHRRSEAVRLWQEIREDGLDRWAEPDGPNGPDGPVEGVVLERVDTRSTAAVTVSDPAPGSPDATEVLPATGSRTLGPRPRPRRPAAGRERRLPLVALVTAALFGITTVTAAAVVVLLTRQYATASAAGTAPRADASPGPVPVPAPAGSSPGPSPSAPTPPPPTQTATPPPGPQRIVAEFTAGADPTAPGVEPLPTTAARLRVALAEAAEP
ncbi:hypothetical protein ACFV0A_12265, partial [Streptomyces sp. NPDC059552]